MSPVWGNRLLPRFDILYKGGDSDYHDEAFQFLLWSRSVNQGNHTINREDDNFSLNMIILAYVLHLQF